jgi:hypothetical protein
VSSLFRLTLSALVCGAVALLMAIILAVVDLYMVGHGYRSLLAPVLVFGPWGVALSPGDIVMLVVASAAAVLAWYLLPTR